MGKKVRVEFRPYFKDPSMYVSKIFSVKGKFSLVAVSPVALKRNAEQMKEIIVY